MSSRRLSAGPVGTINARRARSGRSNKVAFSKERVGVVKCLQR